MDNGINKLFSFLGNLVWMKIQVVLKAEQGGKLPVYLGSAIRGVIGPRLEVILGKVTHESSRSQLIIDTQFMNQKNFTKGDTVSFEICLLGDFRKQIHDIIAIVGREMQLGEKKLIFSVQDLYLSPSPSLQLENAKIKLVPRLNNGMNFIKKAKLKLDKTIAEIEILSPMRLRNKGSLLTQFDVDIFFRRVWDRVLRYDLQSSQRERGSVLNTPHFVDLILYRSDNKWFSLEGLSYRQEKLHSLSGLVGRYRFGPMTLERWALLFAGELLHAGEKTNFGLGRYRIRKAFPHQRIEDPMSNAPHEAKTIEDCYVVF
mgnify:CR=1 FL=1